MHFETRRSSRLTPRCFLLLGVFFCLPAVCAEYPPLAVEISPEHPLTIEIVGMGNAEGLEGFRKNEPKTATPPKIIVRNNLQRKSSQTHSNRVGLDNLRQRYELLGVAGFELRDDGHYFTVVLPLVEV